MAQARNHIERTFANFLSECNRETVIVAYDHPVASITTFTSFDREQLLARNKEGESWLMVCISAICNSHDSTDEQFYRGIFTLIISQALEKNCFRELVALTDAKQLTIFDWIEKKKQRDLYKLFLVKLLNSEKDKTTKFFSRTHFIDNFALLRQHQQHIPAFDFLLLDTIPDPDAQIGYHCGYYAAALVTKYWSLQDNFYRAYPARLFGPDKKKGVSLKMLGKEAGMTGVGGIYDVNYFASILQETEYHSQVVDFETEDEFHALLKRALSHQLPVILPVDWSVNWQITTDSGKRAHYITILGCVSGDDTHQAFFVSSKEFFSVSFHDLFKSTRNLQKTPEATFFKSRFELPIPEGWSNKKDFLLVPEASPQYKYHTVAEQDLKNLRRKMVLIYPKTKKTEVSRLFENKKIHPNLSIRNNIAKTRHVT